jgi:hypothetical protein
MTKILCVEDSEDNLFTLHKRLSLAGFEVKSQRMARRASIGRKRSGPISS